MSSDTLVDLIAFELLKKTVEDLRRENEELRTDINRLKLHTAHINQRVILLENPNDIRLGSDVCSGRSTLGKFFLVHTQKTRNHALRVTSFL